MNPSEAAYFEGDHCHHVAAYHDHLRDMRIARRMKPRTRMSTSALLKLQDREVNTGNRDAQTLTEFHLACRQIALDSHSKGAVS